MEIDESTTRIALMRPGKTLPAIAAFTTALLAGSAYAGPDWTSIERGRADKQALQATAAQTKGGTLTLQNYGPRPQYILQENSDHPRSVATASAR